MTRPLHRSRGFWFGLAGLLFILGMWLHSARWTIKGEIAKDDQSDGVWVYHSCGLVGVHCGWNEVPTGARWGMSGVFRRNGNEAEAYSRVRGPRWRWTYSPPSPDPSPGDPAGRSPGYYFGGLVLPHWLLVVFYLSAWYGVHRWMRRRRRRSVPVLEER